MARRRLANRTLNAIWQAPGGWLVIIAIFIIGTPLNIAQSLSRNRFWEDWAYELAELWKARQEADRGE